MRISLLLQREPFGRILERTLAEFWLTQTGRQYEVQWHNRRPNLWTLRRQNQQTWLCNIYLNAFFVSSATHQVFEPIRQEFEHSLRWWLRPAQRVYVTVATKSPTAAWLASASIEVMPALQDAENLLIVAGNHKIRLLDRSRQLTYGVLKHGFRAEFMRHEIEARRMAEELGLPVPALQSVGADLTWFREQYVSGKPINRLTDQSVRQCIAVSMARHLRRMLEQTAQSEAISEYASGVHWRIRQLIEEQHLISHDQKQVLGRLVDRNMSEIDQWSKGNSATIITARTHGDFQPANILVNKDGNWLIDWEYSERRQTTYDALVYELSARSPRGLAGRILQFLDTGPSVIETNLWPDTDQSRAVRNVRLRLFFLEELELQLNENANRCFSRLGDSLTLMMGELDLFVKATGAL